MSQNAEIIYFDRPGPENTDELMNLVRQRLARGDVKHVAVATTSGRTALRAAQLIDNASVQIAAIAFQSEYWGDHGKPDEQIAAEAEARGVRFIPDKPKVSYWHEAGGESADTLRKFGQGIKVALEVVMMAVEAGMIPAGAKAIGIGGSSKGADAAVVATAAGPEKIGEFFVHEILAKPLVAK
jgi:hypothetical protein